MQSLRHAKNAGNRNLELAHWLYHIIGNDRSDIALTLDHYKVDRAKVLTELGAVIDGMRKNVTEMPGIATQITDVLDRGWHYATLLFGEAQIRTGHMLLAALKGTELKSAAVAGLEDAREPRGRPPRRRSASASGPIPTKRRSVRWTARASPRPARTPGGGEAGPARGQSALARFSQDMTAIAESGKMDPIVGRDDEIRQIIDVLLRRRQNNPILTGEAGVGKTAVVEGFAQRLAAGDVPPQLKGNRLMALDIGLMQAGASMKGEFEQRLRSVIDEVQGSPIPIILFIDEIHTLIGAGGQAGTGDAANLLKPALARGTLRTIGATTWSEYRQYIEKDPALTRRFQPVNVDEPSIEKAQYMLRGLLAPMEKHHGVRISDEAVVAAVELSARYIPARQLPDKAVSLLDTACSRVAISQSTTPALISDLKDAINARARRSSRRSTAQSDIGGANPRRTDELNAADRGDQRQARRPRGQVRQGERDRHRDRQAAPAARRGEEGRKDRRRLRLRHRTGRPPRHRLYPPQRPPIRGRRRSRRCCGSSAPRPRPPASRHPEAALRPRLRAQRDEPRHADDLSLRRRAVGRGRRLRLDRHPGRQDGQRRGPDHPQARRARSASASSARTTASR